MPNRKFAMLRSNIMLVITALIWGSAFVAQYIGSSTLEPFSFNTTRMIIGSVVLLPVILLSDKLGIGHKPQNKQERKLLWQGGIACGVVMFFASNLQQIGIGYTTAGKAGFITAMYVVLVPVLQLFFGRRSKPIIWIGVTVSVVGLYLLCVKGDFSVNIGDLMILACAFCYAIHILVISRFSSLVDGVRMSCIQFAVASLIGLPFMLFLEQPAWSAVWECRYALLYAGVLSCGVAYTLQILAQRDADPTVASLLMSLESVFAVLSDWIVLHRVLSTSEVIGAALIFCAVILAQLPDSLFHSIRLRICGKGKKT